MRIRQRQHLRKASDKSAVKNAVIIGSSGTVVVNDPYFADLFRLLHKGRNTTGILHMEAHLKVLIIRAVLLGVDIGDVKVELVDQLQHIGNTARNIFQSEFNQHNAGIRCSVLEIADFFQFCIRRADLTFRTFHIQKQHMGVHSFVITDTGNIHAQRGNTLTGLQKGADMVGHRGCICLFHNDHHQQRNWVAV